MTTEDRSEESTTPRLAANQTRSSREAVEANGHPILPTPDELVGMLSRQVIGQSEAKRCVAVAVYQHFMNCARADTYGGRVEPENNVMLIGPTGCGKSLLLRSLGEILDGIPMFFVSCPNITADGYKGKNLVEHLDSIAETIVANGSTRPAIVVWDEVDKLSVPGEGEAAEGANIYREMTQTDFLFYLDGARCGSEGELDTSRILNIGIGAFAGINSIRNPDAKPTIGFHRAQVNQQETLPSVTPEHLITYGLIPEFVGRFPRVATLDPLDHGSMRRILTDAQDNVMARRKEFFSLHGVRLEITDDAIDALVSEALLHCTGARALRLVFDRMLRPVEHRLPEMAETGVLALIYDRDAALGISLPIEHTGKPVTPSKLLELRRYAACPKRMTVPDKKRTDELGIF